MFRSISLRNFRSYEDTGDVPLAPLTILVGPNNSGKSTLLKALLMLKQTLLEKSRNVSLVTSGSETDLGGFYEVLRGGRQAKDLSFSVTISLDESAFNQLIARDSDPDLPQGDTIGATFSFDASRNRVLIDSAFTAREHDILFKVSRVDREISVEGLQPGAERHIAGAFNHFLPSLTFRKQKQEDPIPLRSLNYIIASEYQGMSWVSLADRIKHIAPLRKPVPWFYILGTTSGSDLGASGENLLAVLSDQQVIEGKRTTLQRLVDTWISKRFGLTRKLWLRRLTKDAEILSLVGDDKSGFKAINVAAMGEGLSQVLPIVAMAARSDNPDCILIEQPEIHLHPKAQADLGDLFVETIASNDNRQLIIETHSEHLLLRVRRRIAEGRIAPEDVSVLYVEKHERGSTIRRLELTKEGLFPEWPTGFFEEAYQEALAIVTARK